MFETVEAIVRWQSHRILSLPQEDGIQFYWALGDHRFWPTPGSGSLAKWGFKILFTFFFGGGGQQGFFYWMDEGNPSPTGQKLLIPPTSPQPTRFNFSIENVFFSEKYHDIKNTLIHKVNCNLKLKFMCFILS